MAAITPFLDRTVRTEDTGTDSASCPVLVDDPPGGPLQSLDEVIGAGQAMPCLGDDCGGSLGDAPLEGAGPDLVPGIGPPKLGQLASMGDFGVVKDVPLLERSHAELTRTVWIRRALEERLMQDGPGGGPRDYWIEADCKTGELFFHLSPAMEKDILPWYVGVKDTPRFSLFGSNGKMKCPTWDLPAGAPSVGGTCPGATAGQSIVEPRVRYGQMDADQKSLAMPPPGSRGLLVVDEARAICQNCYALEGNYPSPHVQIGEILRYWWSKSMLDEGRGEEWVDVMVRAVGALNIPRTRQGIRPIRVHSAGDFFNPNYAAAWMEVANRVWDLEAANGRATPEIRFWAPTRTWAARGFDWRKIAERLQQPNMIVRPSAYHVDDDAPGPLVPGWPGGTTSVINGHNRGMAPELMAPLQDLAEDGGALLRRLEKRGPLVPHGANEKQRKAAHAAHERELGGARAMVNFAKVEAARDRSSGHDERFEWSCQTYAIDIHAKGADLSHSCEDAAAPDGKIGCRMCWTHPQLRVNYTTH